jgi:alginate O-acetyltransferase complex protein AlgI
VHGLFLIVDRRWRQTTAGWPRWQAFRSTLPGRLSGTGLVVLCFALSLVLFRAPNLTQAWEFYQRLFWPRSGESLQHLVMRGDFLLLALVAGGHCVGEWIPWQRHWRRLPAWILAVCYALATLVIGSLAPPAGKLFIYFQF